MFDSKLWEMSLQTNEDHLDNSLEKSSVFPGRDQCCQFFDEQAFLSLNLQVNLNISKLIN